MNASVQWNFWSVCTCLGTRKAAKMGTVRLVWPLVNLEILSCHTSVLEVVVKNMTSWLPTTDRACAWSMYGATSDGPLSCGYICSFYGICAYGILYRQTIILRYSVYLYTYSVYIYIYIPSMKLT